MCEGIFLFAQQQHTGDGPVPHAAQELLPASPSLAQMVQINFPIYTAQVQTQLVELLETEAACQSLLR